jgi:beta-glucosidase
MAVANIQGLQSAGVLANVKHFVANDQETDRGTINGIVSERTLREVYLLPFEAAVREGRTASVMCAYPRVNGDYDCENLPLLRKMLKDEWGFDGFVTTDFFAAHSTVPSALAGMDLEMPSGIYYGDKLKKAIEDKQVPVAVLDEMLVRRFSKMIELGLFDSKPAVRPIPAFEHGAIARSIAAQSMVLLKNEGGILPLDREKIQKVVLIGSHAMHSITGGGGSSHVIPLYSVQPVDGIEAALRSQTMIKLLDGYDIPAAVKAAAKSNVAIVMVGDDEGEDHDHAITLPDEVNRLVEAVAAVNPHTVVVLKSGSAIVMPWIDKVPAVLEAWYPGEEDGDAVADVLLGKVNPSGKLPLTFPARVEDTQAANRDCYPGDGKIVHYCEGLNIGYRNYQTHGVKPLFPFGYGLSYTTFHLDDLRVKRSADGFVARVRVTNTGKRAGSEVAQLYLSYPSITEGAEPPHQLRSFQQVQLQPGETKEVVLAVDRRGLSWWSEKQHGWQLARGEFLIEVGDSSADTPLHASLAIK